MTQKAVWKRAFRIVTVVPFLLNKPRSKMTASINTMPKVKYETFDELIR
jgi:hypothetical protein